MGCGKSTEKITQDPEKINRDRAKIKKYEEERVI
jgi:hypothetical protein